MRKRLYYVFPSQEAVHKVVNELLLKRIEISHMHVLGPEGADLKNLPTLTMLQKHNALKGVLMGCGVGAVVGIVGGLIGHYIGDMHVSGAIIATVLVGAIMGGWGSGLISSSAPNPELKKFQEDLKQGHYLLMVDVPKDEAQTIESFIQSSLAESHSK